MSKYFDKTHEEVEYEMTEYKCYACNEWFMVDFNRMFMKGGWYYFFCPYCGKSHKVMA